MADCPGPCNARAREAREAYEQAMALYDPLDPAQERPQPPDIQPWEGEVPYAWCRRCQSEIVKRLGQLDDAICVLRAFGDGHRDAPDGPLVASSGEAMSPSEALDVAERLWQMLLDWEDGYRSWMGWAASSHDGDLAGQTTECLGWLISHLWGAKGILSSAYDGAKDFGEEILSAHAQIRNRAKAGTRKLRKPMRCPGCQQLTLVWTEGDNDVTCGACHLKMSYSEYEAEVLRRTGGAAALWAVVDGTRFAVPLASMATASPWLATRPAAHGMDCSAPLTCAGHPGGCLMIRG